MTKDNIKGWFRYWQNTSGCGVAVNEIRSLEDVAQARRFCKTTFDGMGALSGVTDGEIWEALREYRGERVAA